MKDDMPIDYLIMEATEKMLKHVFRDLTEKSPIKPRWIEMRPRNEDFADRALSIWISTNDPENPGSWQNEAILAWPRQKGNMRPDYAGRSFNTLGGGQGFYRRFTLGFFLLFTELGIPRQQALVAGNAMMQRIHNGFINPAVSRKFFGVLSDKYVTIVDYDKAVQKTEATPSGSEEDTIFRGKIYLEFAVYHEPTWEE